MSVIIPAYNEAERLPLTLIDIERFLSKKKYRWEIVVADDGSTDNTREIVKKFSQFIKNIKLASNGLNKGRGAAIRLGMAAARGDFLVCMDADNSTKAEEIDKTISLLKKGYGVVVGSRFVKGSRIDKNLPLARRMAEFFLIRLSRILFLAGGVQDVFCGFKCFSEKAAGKIFSVAAIDGWAADTEILSLAKKFGYKIKEVPIFWNHDSRSKMRFIDYWGFVCQTFKIRKKLWSNTI